MKNSRAIFFTEKPRTSTIEIFWKIENVGIGGCFNINMNRMPTTDSCFLMISL
ncbi:MAG: hypothetical protein PHP04_04300 [Bacteroidales bacterium]|nr:hypothetical protein [Bacteroidales bacterium]HNW73588.1 hypothetical protein [Bacteroidales bacterium]